MDKINTFVAQEERYIEERSDKITECITTSISKHYINENTFEEAHALVCIDVERFKKRYEQYRENFLKSLSDEEMAYYKFRKL